MRIKFSNAANFFGASAAGLAASACAFSAALASAFTSSRFASRSCSSTTSLRISPSAVNGRRSITLNPSSLFSATVVALSPDFPPSLSRERDYLLPIPCSSPLRGLRLFVCVLSPFEPVIPTEVGGGTPHAGSAGGCRSQPTPLALLEGASIVLRLLQKGWALTIQSQNASAATPNFVASSPLPLYNSPTPPCYSFLSP
jgi:hypothetical protein